MWTQTTISEDLLRDVSTNDIHQTRDHPSVVALRGAAPLGIGRGFWRVLVGLALLTFAVVLVVSFVSAAHDRARLERLTHHGIATNAVVDTCIGNLGGSGSNASSYTCRASYVVSGTNYHEVIGLMSAFASPGTRIAVVADPARPSTIELASAVAASHPSTTVFVVPGLLALVLAALTAALVRQYRRTPTRAAPQQATPDSWPR